MTTTSMGGTKLKVFCNKNLIQNKYTFVLIKQTLTNMQCLHIPYKKVTFRSCSFHPQNNRSLKSLLLKKRRQIERMSCPKYIHHTGFIEENTQIGTHEISEGKYG